MSDSLVAKLKCIYRLVVRTRGFQPRKGSSILPRCTKSDPKLQRFNLYGVTRDLGNDHAVETACNKI